jgi:hypothetical protein
MNAAGPAGGLSAGTRENAVYRECRWLSFRPIARHSGLARMRRSDAR